MGTMKMAGDGSMDFNSNTPDAEMPSASRSGNGPIDMVGDGDKDTNGVSESEKVNSGLGIDQSGKGKIDFAGNN